VTDYLYSAAGNYIGFRHDGYVFTATGDWRGWISGDDEVVFRPDGTYLGDIIEGDLLVRRTAPPRLPLAGRPQRPTRPPQPARPPRRTRRHLPTGYTDLDG